MEQYPDAILSYPVDQSKFEYSDRLAGEFSDELVEMHPDNVGPGNPKYRHIVRLK